MTIRPQRARSIGFSARRVSRNAAVRFVSSTVAHSSSPSEGDEVVAADAGVVDEHEHGTAEVRLEALEELVGGPPGSATSPASAVARPPSLSISATTASAPSWSAR